MAVPREWLQLLGQAIAALAVIGSNQSAIKAEVAPLKTEQAIINVKITGLSEKVGQIEKKVKD